MQTSLMNPDLLSGFSDKIDKMSTRVVIQTPHEVILGDFYHRPRLRLIDELIAGEQYLAITNAIVYERSGKVRFRAKFLPVNRDYVMLLDPWDEMERKKDTQQFTP